MNARVHLQLCRLRDAVFWRRHVGPRVMSTVGDDVRRPAGEERGPDLCWRGRNPGPSSGRQALMAACCAGFTPCSVGPFGTEERRLV